MLLANGCPGSGTHALMAMLAAQGKVRIPGLLDGLDVQGDVRLRATRADPEPMPLDNALALPDNYFVHAHVPYPRIEGRVITMRRDPRNVLVSFMRKLGVSFEQALAKYAYRPFVEVYRSFLGWPEVVRYEDLGFMSGPNLYENSARNHSTWTGQPSNWREWWNEDRDRMWRAVGGHELVIEAGYS